MTGPRWAPRAVAAFGVVAGVWIFAAGWPVPQRYFAEGRVGTWLTVGGLLGTGVTLGCGAMALAGLGGGTRVERWLGWWLSFLFTALAADDAFSFHERADHWIRRALGLGRSALGQELGVVLLAGAGVVLIVSLVSARRLRERYRATFRWWVGAAVFGAAMMLLDGLTEDRRILRRVMGLGWESAVWWKYRLEGLEEASKMIGVYLFWAGAVAAFGSVVHRGGRGQG